MVPSQVRVGVSLMKKFMNQDEHMTFNDAKACEMWAKNSRKCV